MRSITNQLRILFSKSSLGCFFSQEFISSFFLLITFVLTLTTANLSVAAGTNSPLLLTIDHNDYTSKDFRQWWEYWREADSVFPDAPDKFIEWQLLSREALAMELDQEPSFKRKVETFIKVRALMLLKNEAVDRHLTSSEAELEEMYNEKYSPRWQTAVLYFNDFDTADEAAKVLHKEGGKDLPEIVNRLKGIKVAYSAEKLYRPINIPDNWQSEFLKLREGEVGPPLAMGEGYVLVYLFSKKSTAIKVDSEDYYDLRDAVKARLMRQKQAQYTDELIRGLLEKYKVHIDEDLLAAVDIINPQQELLHEILISTTKGDVTIAAFLDNIKRNQRVRRQDLTDKKAQTAEKWSVARGIISQSVTTWESLDRHYEEKPPFKVTYQLYRQHRLLKELERLVFKKNINIQADDIVAYYDENIKNFTREPTVSYTVVTGSYPKIKKLWAKSLSSGNMVNNARKAEFSVKQHGGVVISGVDPDIGRILAKLNPDEMSMPVKTDDGAVLVWLAKRQVVGDALPLDQVYKKIRTELGRQQVREAKKKFVDELKAKSTIRLKKEVWQGIKRELSK